MKNSIVYLLLFLLIATSISPFHDEVNGVTEVVETRSSTVIVDQNGSGDFVLIQDAIDNCENNSIISIKNGHYFENITVNKPLTLIGESRENTIVNGSNNNSIILESDGIRIEDLSVTGGNKPNQYYFLNCGIIFSVRLRDFFFITGIAASFVKDITIKNVYVHHNDIGIYLMGCSDVVIQNSNISQNICGVAGRVDDKDIDIIDNIFWNNFIGMQFQYLASQLIEERGSENITIDGNRMSTNVGIDIEENLDAIIFDQGHTKNLRITNNVVHNFSSNGIYIGSHAENILVADNVIYNIGGDGIRTSYYSDVIIERNQLSNCRSGIYSGDIISNNVCNNNRYFGIEHGSVIVNNTCNENGKGGILSGGDVSSNICIGNDVMGIEAKGSSGRISDNIIEDNGIYGIRINGSRYVDVFNNGIKNSKIGICVIDSIHSDIFSNDINSNQYGIIISYSNGTMVFDNSITDNTILGVDVNNSAMLLDPNNTYFLTFRKLNENGNSVFFGNHFNNNGDGIDQVRDLNITDQWDNGTIGNYWSDWASPDNDEDGIVDHSRPINYTLGIWDRFPMVSNEWDDSDNDGFLDITEEAYGTDIHDPSSHPSDVDGDLIPDDRDYTSEDSELKVWIVFLGMISSIAVIGLVIILGVILKKKITRYVSQIALEVD